jgi:hypothetical protein
MLGSTQQPPDRPVLTSSAWGAQPRRPRRSHPTSSHPGACPLGGTIGPVTSTETLESPKTSDADTGDELFHYVRKAKIAESAVMGTFVQALCGEVFPVTKAPKPGSPVCPRCKEIYDSLPSGGGSDG